MIRRTATAGNGFMLRYEAMQDSRLSYRARGVLAAVLSRPSDWRTSAEALALGAPEGRDAIRAALDELVTAGYLRRERFRSSRGRVWGYSWDISDSPTTGLPTSVDQRTARQRSAVQSSANQRPGDRRPAVQSSADQRSADPPSLDPPSLGQAYEIEERDGGETPPPAPARRSPSPEVEALVGVVRRALPRTTPPPGLPTLRRACADAVDAGWTPAAMDRAIRGHDWTGARSGAVVALVRALAEEGPAAAPTDGQDRPDWCGRCDETTRMVTAPETGAQARCGRCHPLAGTVPASVARRLREAEEEAAMRRLHLVPSPRGDG